MRSKHGLDHMTIVSVNVLLWRINPSNPIKPQKFEQNPKTASINELINDGNEKKRKNDDMQIARRHPVPHAHTRGK